MGCGRLEAGWRWVECQKRQNNLRKPKYLPLAGGHPKGNWLGVSTVRMGCGGGDEGIRAARNMLQKRITSCDQSSKTAGPLELEGHNQKHCAEQLRKMHRVCCVGTGWLGGVVGELSQFTQAIPLPPLLRASADLGRV